MLVRDQVTFRYWDIKSWSITSVSWVSRTSTYSTHLSIWHSLMGGYQQWKVCDALGEMHLSGLPGLAGPGTFLCHLIWKTLSGSGSFHHSHHFLSQLSITFPQEWDQSPRMWFPHQLCPPEVYQWHPHTHSLFPIMSLRRFYISYFCLYALSMISLELISPASTLLF